MSLLNSGIFRHFPADWLKATKTLNLLFFWIFGSSRISGSSSTRWLHSPAAPDIDRTPFEVCAVSAVCDLKPMDVLDAHFAGAF
ncbi:MAG: hypothetical protein GEV13_03390 [Rhodospirillales bacterium]|nr:hypothetical protein [Rhodospirillales bacterium]